MKVIKAVSQFLTGLVLTAVVLTIIFGSFAPSEESTKVSVNSVPASVRNACGYYGPVTRIVRTMQEVDFSNYRVYCASGIVMDASG